MSLYIIIDPVHSSHSVCHLKCYMKPTKYVIGWLLFWKVTQVELLLFSLNFSKQKNVN